MTYGAVRVFRVAGIVTGMISLASLRVAGGAGVLLGAQRERVVSSRLSW